MRTVRAARKISNSTKPVRKFFVLLRLSSILIIGFTVRIYFNRGIANLAKKRKNIKILSRYSILAAFLIAVGLISLFKIVDFDVWFHLSFGRQIALLGHLPKYETFAYTIAGSKAHSFEWLFGLAVFAIYKLGGPTLLILAKVAAVIAIFVIVLLTAIRRGAPYHIAIAVTLASAFVARERFTERPQLITALFLALTIFILVGFAPTSRKKWIWVLPPAFVVWANFHPGVFFGIAAVWLILIGEAIKTRGMDSVKVLFPVAVLSSLAAFLTPDGFGIISFMVQNATVTGSKVAENVPILVNPVGLGFLLIVALFMLMELKDFDPIDLLLVVPFGLMAFRTNREILNFAVIAAPVLALNIQRFSEMLDIRVVTYKKFGSFYDFGYSMAIFALTLIVILSTQEIYPFGMGIAKETYPAGAVKIIKKYRPKPNMFNTFTFGEYLIWKLAPAYPVFYDGRYVPYVKLMKRIASDRFSDTKWEKLMSDYKVNFALVDTLFGGFEFNFPKKTWALVYWDDVSALYVRRKPQNRAMIGLADFKIVDPSTDYNVLKNLIAKGKSASAERELKRAAEMAPDMVQARLDLAMLYKLEGRKKLALREYRSAEKIVGYISDYYRESILK